MPKSDREPRKRTTSAGGKSAATATAKVSRSAPKVQRWVDLLAALLVRHYPATFSELADDVPAYTAAGKSESARMRMFERDKDELRAFGVPIETVDVIGDDGARGSYRLARRDFYLPYLHVVARDGRRQAGPRRVDRHGYQALTALAFEPDELEAVVDAAARVRTLGDPLLASESASAMRKLSADLPMDTGAPGDVSVVPASPRPSAELFEAVGDALARRKTLTFAYHAMSTDRTETRSIEPYGLFFLGAHWYLTGRDRARGELRNFRLSRVSQPAVNTRQPQSPDYTVPSTFRLREHARSRHAWELGDGDAIEAVVEFRGDTGAVTAAARLGAPVADAPRRRCFQLRRIDPFARWLLSFGGDAVPVAPPHLVELYATHVRNTLALYAADREAPSGTGAGS